jgi:hypothetical protein
MQVNAVLAGTAARSGYARIAKRSGSGRFVAYGILNDGTAPGLGTGDGSYLGMSIR